MTAGFYKKYWNVVGKVINSVVLDFLNRGADLNVINHTNVILILKKRSSSSPMDFRPISLCNVIYKIIAKVLANRLKVVLPQIIDESQSAFVQGRMIFDNIIVAHETMHSMKNRSYGRIGLLTAKLDMSKDYDRVE